MSVAVCLPTGEAKRIHLSSGMTVQQLRQKAVDETRRLPGFGCVRPDNVSLTLEGRTLENSSPLSDCKILPSSVIHLVLKVHGG